MRLGIAVLRIIVGVLFMGHGLQKLKGWFGGYGPDATGEAFAGMGLKPGTVHATAAGVSETAGGALLATGLFTPFAGAAITGTMAVAIERVHLRKGPWVSEGGFEYNLVLIAACFAIVAAGPGPLSLDRVLGTERSGPAWALAELVAGLAGGGAVLAAGRAVAKRDDTAAQTAAVNETAAEPVVA